MLSEVDLLYHKWHGIRSVDSRTDAVTIPSGWAKGRGAMTEQEINRAIQYVTAATSYGRETVEAVVRTCLTELASLAEGGCESYRRDVLMEYVCQWTIKHTGQPEPLVREVLGCAGRWLDDMYAEVAAQHPETFGRHEDDDNGLTTA